MNQTILVKGSGQRGLTWEIEMEMVFMALFMGFAAIIWVGVVAFGFLTYSWIKDLLKESK